MVCNKSSLLYVSYNPTNIIPYDAHANSTILHSGLFLDKIPILSPFLRFN